MWWWSLPALGAPELASERVDGPLDARFRGGDGAALSLLVVGEHDGQVGPCGCSTVPRGGLPRLATAVAARRADDPTPELLLHAGNWLSAATDADVLTRAAVEADLRMHAAIGRLPFDALNTTLRDLPTIALGPHPGMLCANVTGHGQPVLAAKRFDRAGHRVVVAGVSAPGLVHLQPAGTTWEDPVRSLERVSRLPGDVVVVLAYDLSDRIEDLAAAGAVDVVVDAGAWQGVWEPRAVGDTVVVRSTPAGASLLELRLWLTDGRVTRAVQRTVPLDAAIPDDPFVAAGAPPRRAD